MEDDRIAHEKSSGNQGNGEQVSWRCNRVLSVIHDDDESSDI
jgi:hypothetical protein